MNIDDAALNAEQVPADGVAQQQGERRLAAALEAADDDEIVPVLPELVVDEIDVRIKIPRSVFHFLLP